MVSLFLYWYTTLISLFVFFDFSSVVCLDDKFYNTAGSLFCLVNYLYWPRLGDLFVSQNPREFHAPHSLGEILVCSYTV